MSDLEDIITLLDDMRLLADLRVHELVSPDNWDVYSDLCDLIYLAKESALTLLQKQKAVEPYMDYDGQDVWRCGKCGNSLMHPSYYESDEDAKNHIRYCSHCGQAVK